jgi:NAD(P)-dependent dehydrogenase (short-subunit alcohol dehydrogenase family)
MAQNEPRRLSGKVAIVTGAGRGIGRAEAMLLAQQGARVVVNDLGGAPTGPGADAGVAQSVADEIRKAGGEAVANSESVAEWAAAKRIVEQALDTYGRLDILINNAGILRPKTIDEMLESDWDDVVATHLKGHFAMARHAAPVLIKQRSGAIVNTSSHSGLGHYGMSNYAAAKEGIIGFTRSIARDLGPHNIRCNAVRPGANTRIAIPAVIETVRKSQEDFGFPGIGDMWVVPRPSEATSEQAAGLAVWLCTDAAKNINGRTLLVHGEEIGLFSEPEVTRGAYRTGGWDLDALDDPAAQSYVFGGLKNQFLPQRD